MVVFCFEAVADLDAEVREHCLAQDDAGLIPDLPDLEEGFHAAVMVAIVGGDSGIATALAPSSQFSALSP